MTMEQIVEVSNGAEAFIELLNPNRMIKGHDIFLCDSLKEPAVFRGTVPG